MATSPIFDTLPGLEAPVGSISRSLADMWKDTAEQGKSAPATEDAKATQVNFVLHLGFATTEADATTQFHTAVNFSRRYPSRVVVLCPMRDDSPAKEMRAKVYGECTLGKTKDDTRCCEFVMLSYPRSTRQFLENQVSICLSTDLPLYYWAHRFSTSARLAEYHYLLTRAQRVLIDSAIAPADALTYPWPKPEAVRDLVFARLLPVRQSIGQFLSRYPMSVLVDGLRDVVVNHGPALAAEARSLQFWLRERIVKCGGDTRIAFSCAPTPKAAPQSLSFRFGYGNRHFCLWRADFGRGRSEFTARYAAGATGLTAPASMLPPEASLSEAMFF